MNYSKNTESFKGLHVIDIDTQKLLLKSLNDKQLKIVSNLIKEQENNSVHILLDSSNGKTLKSTLMCAYRLKNFKTQYKQIPIIESKFHFIKRIANIANKYKKQIESFKPLKLNWSYSVLSEWFSKIY